MLTKLPFHAQQRFALFGRNNSDFFSSFREKDFSLLQILRSDKIGMRHHQRMQPTLQEYLLY